METLADLTWAYTLQIEQSHTKDNAEIYNTNP